MIKHTHNKDSINFFWNLFHFTNEVLGNGQLGLGQLILGCGSTSRKPMGYRGFYSEGLDIIYLDREVLDNIIFYRLICHELSHLVCVQIHKDHSHGKRFLKIEASIRELCLGLSSQEVNHD